MRSATLKNHSKSSQKPSKMFPKPFQKPVQILPKLSPNPPLKKDASKTRPKIYFLLVLDDFFEFFEGPGCQIDPKSLKIAKKTWKIKLKKTICFSTPFVLVFLVVLAFQNGSKIIVFSTMFPKRRFRENYHETLAVRTKIKVWSCKKHKKSRKNRCQNHDRKKHRKKLLKNRFWPRFWPPITFQNHSKIQKNHIWKRR